jgi:hypothetical protein
MRHSVNTRSLILGAIAALLLAVAIPSTALAQGRGHGRGHGNGDWSSRVERSGSNRDWRNRSANLPNYSKKCGKFVNCHDARNGRWDGRGPRRNRLGNVVWRNRLRNRNTNNVWRYRTLRNGRRVIANR